MTTRQQSRSRNSTTIVYKHVCRLILCAALPGSMWATSVGLSYDQQGYVESGAVESPGYPDEGVTDLLTTSYSDGFNLVGADGSTSQVKGHLRPAKGNVALGEFASITQAKMFSEASANMFFADTFHISGPTGATGNLLIHLVLDSNVSYSGDLAGYAKASLVLIENGTYYGFSGYDGSTIASLLNLGTSPHQDFTINLPVAAGATFTLDQFLQVNAYDLNAATVDAANTGYMTIVSTTPGFSFSTDSGLSYADAPLLSSAPEPTTAALFATFGVFFVIWLCRMRSRKEI